MAAEGLHISSPTLSSHSAQMAPPSLLGGQHPDPEIGGQTNSVYIPAYFNSDCPRVHSNSSISPGRDRIGTILISGPFFLYFEWDLSHRSCRVKLFSSVLFTTVRQQVAEKLKSQSIPAGGIKFNHTLFLSLFIKQTNKTSNWPFFTFSIVSLSLRK